jgi:ABC-2 type transport system permease protein
MIHNIDYQLDKYLPLAIIGLLFALAIYSVSFLISSIFSKKGLVSFISVGVIVLMYVINIVSNLKDSLENLKYFSFFHYFDPTSILAKGEIIDYSYIVLIGVIILTTSLGWYIFNKRDIAV